MRFSCCGTEDDVTRGRRLIEVLEAAYSIMAAGYRRKESWWNLGIAYDLSGGIRPEKEYW